MSWAALSRSAAVALSTGEEREDDSTTVQMLRDIYAVFSANGNERMKTADLLAELYKVEESPWGDWFGKPLSAHGLSRLLKPYRIKTMPVKVDGETVRGYKAEQFSDAFARVLSVTSVTSVTPKSPSQAGGNAGNARNAYPAEAKNGLPLIGDDSYAVMLAEAVKAGHLTELEAKEQRALHDLVVAAQTDGWSEDDPEFDTARLDYLMTLQPDEDEAA